MNHRRSDDLRQSSLGRFLVLAYRFRRLRSLCLRLAGRLEGGDFYSTTLRTIFERYHAIEIGAYSYGECFVPGAFPRGVKVGRYVSIAPGVRVFLRNHPLDRLSMHPFFYNKELGWLAEDSISSGRLEIGHDAWLGERVIITPGCSRIGIGAVVGAGAIVTHDVPDFAVVAGNPARIIRFRFTEPTCAEIVASQWWLRPVSDCVEHMNSMIRPVGADPERHPLLAPAEGKSNEGIAAVRP